MKHRPEDALDAELYRLAGVGFWEWNLTSGAVELSQNFRSLFGLPERGTLARRDFRKMGFPAANDPQLLPLRDCLEKGRPWDITCAVTNSAGSRLHIRSTGRGDWARDGSLRYFGILQDVTHQVEEAAALTRRGDDAESEIRARELFITRLSHELRTPLHGTIGMLELLDRTGSIEPRHSRVGEALRSAKRLAEIVEDFFDGSALTTPDVRLTVGAMQPLRPIEHALASLRSEAHAKGLDLRLHRATPLPEVVAADERRLRQIVTALVGNAIKFTDKGSIDVTLSYDASSAELSICVADTGCGVSADELPRIFQRSQPVEDLHRRTTPGFGIGLSVVRQLTDLMDGRIDVDSVVNKGTQITLHLPAEVMPSSAMQSEAAAGSPETGAAPLRILVAEDNDANQKILRGLLTAAGHQVSIVADGQAAIEAIAEQRFDLVLMDIMMPVMDGEAATRVIRERERTPGALPVIALTAHARFGDRESFLASGFTDYLPKPLDIELLFSVLQRHAVR